jgi:hypothetical protein
MNLQYWLSNIVVFVLNKKVCHTLTGVCLKRGNMSVYNDDNPYGLSPNERRVLHHWQNGETMADAYRKVMLPQIDKELSEAAFNKRVQRFFGTLRM